MTEAGVAFLPLFDSFNNTEPVGWKKIALPF